MSTGPIQIYFKIDKEELFRIEDLLYLESQTELEFIMNNYEEYRLINKFYNEKNLSKNEIKYLMNLISKRLKNLNLCTSKYQSIILDDYNRIFRKLEKIYFFMISASPNQVLCLISKDF